MSWLLVALRRVDTMHLGAVTPSGHTFLTTKIQAAVVSCFPQSVTSMVFYQASQNNEHSTCTYHFKPGEAVIFFRDCIAKRACKSTLNLDEMLSSVQHMLLVRFSVGTFSNGGQTCAAYSALRDKKYNETKVV